MSSEPKNDVERVIRDILDPMWHKLGAQEFDGESDFDAYITDATISQDQFDILSVWIEDGSCFVSTLAFNGPYIFPLGDPDVIPKIRRRINELIEWSLPKPE
jgi:hypothetical protein